MTITHNFALGYKDVTLVPNKCIVKHRSEISTKYKYGDNLELRLPIIPSNMRSVVNHVVYEEYVNYGVMPIMHRFDVDIYSFLSGVATNWKAISVGVNEKDYDQLVKVQKTLPVSKWPNLVCIDIAHGHAYSVEDTIIKIKKLFADKRPIVVAGNVTTQEGVEFLQNCGADMIKVGIGPGQVCSTKNKTGFHVPMFTAVKECSMVAKVPIIADGGIRENGDIAKALVAGADLVMVGGMFAACFDSPATIANGKKEYYGSASAFNKGYNRNIEGFHIRLDPTMTIKDKLDEIEQDLQSSISYAGGNDLSALDISKVKYNVVL